MDKYQDLRRVLHKHPSGAPESEFLDEILRILFTPEEVDVALGMGFAARRRRPSRKWASRWRRKKAGSTSFFRCWHASSRADPRI